MVIDASGLVAILMNEPERVRFVRRIAEAPVRLISVVNYVEAAFVMIGRKGATGITELESFLREADIERVPVVDVHADLAIKAFQTYGKGQGHPARLNCGDCFAYALAKATGYPLLFKGNDFIHTDIVAAV